MAPLRSSILYLLCIATSCGLAAAEPSEIHLQPSAAPKSRTLSATRGNACAIEYPTLPFACLPFFKNVMATKNKTTIDGCCIPARGANAQGCFCDPNLSAVTELYNVTLESSRLVFVTLCDIAPEDVKIIFITNNCPGASVPTALPPAAPPASTPAGDSGKGSGGGGSGVVVGVAAGIGTVVLVVVVLLCYWCRCHKGGRGFAFFGRGDESSCDHDEKGMSSLGRKQFTYKELETATQQFSPKLQLGHGAFGGVYWGKLSNGTVVAIKKMSAEATQGDKAFRAEASIISNLRHKNLVKLIGWCAEKGKRCLVYEFMSGGSLDKLLFDPPVGDGQGSSTLHTSGSGLMSTSSTLSGLGQSSLGTTTMSALPWTFDVSAKGPVPMDPTQENPVPPPEGGWVPQVVLPARPGPKSQTFTKTGEEDASTGGGSSRKGLHSSLSKRNSGRLLGSKALSKEDALKPTPRGPLTWLERVHIAVGVARGLEYLHEEVDVGGLVLHRDVKSSNILLDEDMNARLGDFGLARVLKRDALLGTIHHTTGPAGTLGYLPPEGRGMEWQPNAKWDVFSYGVVLLEVLSGRPAVDIAREGRIMDSLVEKAHELSLEDDSKILTLADPRLQGQFPRSEFLGIARIALWCTAEVSADRPPMKAVVQMLSGHLSLPMKLPPAHNKTPERATPILPTVHDNIGDELPEPVMRRLPLYPRPSSDGRPDSRALTTHEDSGSSHSHGAGFRRDSLDEDRGSHEIQQHSGKSHGPSGAPISPMQGGSKRERESMDEAQSVYRAQQSGRSPGTTGPSTPSGGAGEAGGAFHGLQVEKVEDYEGFANTKSGVPGLPGLSGRSPNAGEGSRGGGWGMSTGLHLGDVDAPGGASKKPDLLPGVGDGSHALWGRQMLHQGGEGRREGGGTQGRRRPGGFMEEDYEVASKRQMGRDDLV